MNKLKIKQKPGERPELPTGEYCFVVGNGTSRKDLDLKPLMDYGILFACNWFFKDEFRPHVLVASDEPMSVTIQKAHSYYPKNNWFYSWFPKPGSGAKKAPCPEKFAAGPMSTHIAAEIFKAPKVFLIGMDFFGFGSNGAYDNGKLNNLYADKKHYVKSENGETGAPTYRNWQRRFQWILRNYPDVEFYHVNPFEGKSPERLRGFKNFHQVTFDNLKDHLENDAPLNDILVKTAEDIELAHAQNPDDLRASIERQLVGQENILFPDKIRPDHLVQIRSVANQRYQKNPDDHVVVKIKDWDIFVPPTVIATKQGQLLASPEQIQELYKKEYVERYVKQETQQEFFASLSKMSEVVEQQDDQKTSFDGLIPPPPPPVV